MCSGERLAAREDLEQAALGFGQVVAGRTFIAGLCPLEVELSRTMYSMPASDEATDQVLLPRPSGQPHSADLGTEKLPRDNP